MAVLPPTKARHHELAARVITVFSANLCEPPKVADVARTLGVSERTLRSAFRDAVGVSPKQYATMQRLGAAHRALASAAPGAITVTDVATAFGFFELGRFAARYRRTFGEVPSRTLRHSAAAESGQAA